MRLCNSFLIDILLVFFLSKTVKQVLNGFLRFETSTFVYRFVVCVFKIVASATSGYRNQSLPQSLNLPAFKKNGRQKERVHVVLKMKRQERSSATSTKLV